MFFTSCHGKLLYFACYKSLLHLLFLSDWFHGDIYSITLENINNLIGFKCHRCRQRNIPVCPYAQTEALLNAQSDEEHSISKFDEDESHNFQEEIGAESSHKELCDYNIEKRLNGLVTVQELNDCLKEQIDQSSLNEVINHGSDQELSSHNKMEGFDSSGFRNEVNDHTSLEELDNQNNLEKHGSYMIETQLNNHSCLNELDTQTNLKELNDHNSGEELDRIESNKFVAEGTQCLKESDSFNSLNLDNNCSIVEEFDNHNCPKESDNRDSSIELDNNRSSKFESTDGIKLASATTHSGDFLAEHFKKIRISSKEALIITSEAGSGNESRALQPKDDSEKPMPPEHDVDLQVLVTL